MSPHDLVWGIEMVDDDSRARDRTRWLGLNPPWEALTRVCGALLREQLRAEPRNAEPLSWPTDLNKNEDPGSG